MITGIALVIGAVVAGWLLPGLLRRRVAPGAAITAWLLCGAGVLGTAVVGIAMIAVSDQPHHLIDACWTAIAAAAAPLRLAAVGTAALALAAIAVSGTRRWRAARATRNRQLALLRVASGAVTPVTWLNSDELVAYSVGGRPGVVVLSHGLRDRLTESQLSAVLAHEHAHLRGHHHKLIGVAETLAATIPLPITRRVPGELRSLAEQAADRAAVRRCGVAAVRGALIAVGGAQFVADRVNQLGDSGPNRPLGVLLPTTAALPGAIGLALVAACASALCPLFLL